MRGKRGTRRISEGGEEEGKGGDQETRKRAESDDEWKDKEGKE